MANIVKAEIKQDLINSIQEFLKNLLNLKDVDAILLPCHLSMKNVVMPELVTDPEQLNRADPLAPAFTLNSAKIVSKLTRKKLNGKIVVVLRPCEIRAFNELVKLKQCQVDNIIIISLDCLGAYSNADYAKFIETDCFEVTKKYYQSVISGSGHQIGEVKLSNACNMCENFVSNSADISICLFGNTDQKQLIMQSNTEKGHNLIKSVGLADDELKEASSYTEKRDQQISKLVKERVINRDKVFEETKNNTSSLEKLSSYLAKCVNCYNCRVACPVCYCKECVFVTDVFEHEPDQYLQWAMRKGSIKMPTDTLFFHLTRLAHMSLSCVGCGQCSNACPNDISLVELFRNVSFDTQKAFDYYAGKDINEKIPLSVFNKDEYADTVGLQRI